MACLSAVAYEAFLLVVIIGGVFSSGGGHWSYSGDEAPAHWANLDGHYASCGHQRQSPINIATKDMKYKESLSMFNMSGYDQVQGKLTLKNNGHSAQVDTTNANWTVTGGSLTDTYRLLQFHFHWGKDSKTGSEHTINSKQYPLEMHMVHMSTKYENFSEAIENDKSLAVITMMFEVGSEDNQAFKELTDNLANVKNSGKNHTLVTFKLEDLMPGNLADYYTYDGSLTTPPCSQVVVWNIFEETVKISENQLAQFRALLNYEEGEDTHGGGNGPMVDNFRPVNPLNGRTVFSSFNFKGHIPSGDEHGHHAWGYAHKGAENWAKMGHNSCSNKHQSPINIKEPDAKYDSSLGAFTMVGYAEKQGVLTLKNNGHSAQVDTNGADWTVTGGSLTDTYKLLQFHFHWGKDSKTGSEHTINSKQYPLEMHMVHMSTKYENFSEAIENDKSLTVITMMFEVGSEDNGAFQEIIQNLQKIMHSEENFTLAKFALRKLMPDNVAEYYTYGGSLTTPPCSEVVVWNIFRQTVKISEKQLSEFRELKTYKAENEKKRGMTLEEGFMYGNYRPVQPLNGRMVRKNFVLKSNDKKQENSATVVAAGFTVLLSSLLASKAYLL